MAAAESQIADAIALHRRGDLAEAERLYRAILETEPRYFAAAHGLGVLCLQRGALADGERLLRLAAEIDPGSAAAHFDRGQALVQMNRPEAAVESFDRALALKPGHAAAWYRRGGALQQLMRIEEAIASYDRALALKPDDVSAVNDRANALRQAGRIEDALADYDKAVALEPGAPLLLCNRGFALQDFGRFDEAMADYDRALSLKPDFAQARQHRGTLLLLQGRMREGFADYEARLENEDIRDPRLREVPRWSGEDPSGKSILVYSDGAFGDLVHFARYLPLLAGQGARVSVLSPAGFHKVLDLESLGIRSIAAVEESYGWRCEVTSLPFLFGTEFDSIPPCLGSFARNPECEEAWRARLPQGTFNIGICWQGDPARHIDRGRSIPLSEFYPLSQIPGVRLVSLQKHHGLEQLASLPPDMTVETFSGFDDGSDAFADTAAIVANLDLVVTSDTAVAHLAAAIGKPTWIALRYVPEWRWLLGRADSPWYPSVRLFRQKEPGRWAPVFAGIAAALKDAPG